MKELVVSQTPFQLLSAICYAAEDIAGMETRDIVILDAYSGAKEQSERIKGTGLFCNVLLAGLPEGGMGRETISTVINRGKMDYIDNCLRKYGVNLIRESYDRLVFASATPLAHDLRRFCLKADGTATLIDDGLGSHTATIYTYLSILDRVVQIDNPTFNSINYKLKDKIKVMINIITSNKYKFGIDSIRLFRPTREEIGRYKQEVQVDELLISEEAKCAVKEVFPTESLPAYRCCEAVYFTFPGDVGEDVLSIERSVLDIISCIVPNLIVRLHPRRVMEKHLLKCSVQIDDGRVAWEPAVASGIIREETVLFGFGSTAQLSPNLLFGSEQPIVVLSELLPDACEIKKTSRIILSDAIARYGHSEKIYRPRSFDELRAVCKLLFK